MWAYIKLPESADGGEWGGLRCVWSQVFLHSREQKENKEKEEKIRGVGGWRGCRGERRKR